MGYLIKRNRNVAEKGRKDETTIKFSQEDDDRDITDIAGTTGELFSKIVILNFHWML